MKVFNIFCKQLVIKLVRIVFFLIPFTCNCQSKILPDSILNVLAEQLAKKGEYILKKTARIDSLKNKLNSLESNNFSAKYDLYEKLNIEFQSYNFDSAFYYANQLIQTSYLLKEKTKIYHAKIHLGFIMLSSGMFKETFDSLHTVNAKYLPNNLKIEYYSLLARAYYDIGEYNKDNFYNPKYTDLGSKYIDSARILCAKNTYDDLYLSGLKNLRNANMSSAKYNLSILIKQGNLNNHQFAITASTLSFIYLVYGDTTQATNLLAQACIRDIQTATRETSAMTSLAELLYKKGNIKYAYDFIIAAMDDAEFYGARQRKIQAGSILPIIASAKINNVEVQKTKLLKYSIGITALATLVLIFIIIFLRQYRLLKKADILILEANNKLTTANYKLTETNNKLTEVNGKLLEVDKIKEEYIGYYFNINSEYLDKIEKFKKSIDQKLMARKFDDINYIINNINLKKEREYLYFSFDKVFLKLFPDFVQIFNSYFNEEDRIILEKDQLLNTELRIFALIRMGISDSEKLAKILGYSLNTIYSYINRIKTKSIIPNEEFKKKIMEIKTI